MSISVVYVIANLDVGGAECHIAQIVPRLDRSLIRPTVFTILNKGDLAADLEESGVTVVGPDYKICWIHMNKLQRAYCLTRSAARLFFFLRRKRPDVVHFFLPMPYLLGGLVAMLAGTRIQVMSRRSLNIYQDRYRGVAWIERWLHGRMSRVLGNSHAVLQNLRDEGVSNQRLSLIYNGVDIPEPATPDERTELYKHLNVDKTDFLVTIVANLIPYKGHEDLLRGLASVMTILPKNWKLICIGNDGHGIKDDLFLLSKELGIAEKIRFVGGRNDVSGILQISDVAVLSSHQEGFSNAVLEGMAAGLPLVVTDVGGNVEAVRDGVDGYVVPPHEPGSMGKAIARLLDDETLRKTMGASARTRAKAKFSVQACVRNYEKMYSEIVS